MSNVSSDAPDPVPESAVPQQHSNVWYAAVALLGVVVIYFGSQILGSLVVYLYPALQHWSEAQSSQWLTHSTSAQFFYILFAEALTLAGLIGMLRLFRWSRQAIGLTRPAWSQVGWGVLAVVPYFALYFVIVSIVSHFYPLNVDQKQEIGFDHATGAIALMLTFISLVVLPPFVEEVMMRGFLYSGLRKAFPKVVSALVVSAIFGIAHLAEGGNAGPLWIGALDTFTLSVVLVSLREMTGNLWAGITLHAVKNGIAYFSLYLAPLIPLFHK